MSTSNKYICVFDFETTGIQANTDYIIQIGALKLKKSDFSLVEALDIYSIPSDPDYTISPNATAVNGITKEILEKKGIPEKAAIQKFIDFSDGCDYLGFNSNNFDVKFLYNTVHRLGLKWSMSNRMFYDSQRIENALHPNNLVCLFQRYTGKTVDEAELGDAHDALTDVRATAIVLQKQMENNNLDWEMLDNMDCNTLESPEGSLRWAVSKNNDGSVKNKSLMFAIGKYKDKDVLEVAMSDPSYVRWLTDNVLSDYSLDIINKYIQSKSLHKSPQA